MPLPEANDGPKCMRWLFNSHLVQGMHQNEIGTCRVILVEQLTCKGSFSFTPFFFKSHAEIHFVLPFLNRRELKISLMASVCMLGARNSL